MAQAATDEKPWTDFFLSKISQLNKKNVIEFNIAKLSRFDISSIKVYKSYLYQLLVRCATLTLTLLRTF